MSARKRKGNLHDYTVNNRVRLVRGGKEYFDLVIQLINIADNIFYKLSDFFHFYKLVGTGSFGKRYEKFSAYMFTTVLI
jgi:hypothetical protein